MGRGDQEWCLYVVEKSMIKSSEGAKGLRADGEERRVWRSAGHEWKPWVEVTSRSHE